MNRPVPVILTAVLLGILGFFQLIAAVGMSFAGVIFLHKGIPAPAQPAPFPAHFLPVMMFGFSLFYVACAVWSILTLIGLFRLRSWARYSVLVIAGLVAAFSGIAAIVSIAVPMVLPHSSGAAPAPGPNIMHGISLFIGAFYLIFTAIGTAMLVYFNLARTRAIFAHADPAVLTPPNTISGRYRPTAISVISWFFMICSPFCLFYAALPIPGILFGFPIYGVAAHAIYIGFALIGFGVGYSLFRLRPEAPIAFIAWAAFGILNMVPIFTPWGQRSFLTYMDKFSAPGAPLPNMMGIMAMCLVFCLAFNAFILWQLYRHREAFTPAPPAPPMPPTQFLEVSLPG